MKINSQTRRFIIFLFLIFIVQYAISAQDSGEEYKTGALCRNLRPSYWDLILSGNMDVFNEGIKDLGYEILLSLGGSLGWDIIQNLISIGLNLTVDLPSGGYPEPDFSYTIPHDSYSVREHLSGIGITPALEVGIKLFDWVHIIGGIGYSYGHIGSSLVAVSSVTGLSYDMNQSGQTDYIYQNFEYLVRIGMSLTGIRLGVGWSRTRGFAISIGAGS